MVSRRVVLGGALAAPATVASAQTRGGGRPAAARPLKILSIDGGGMKGIGAARIIGMIDARLKAAGKPGVADTFDVFAGTSTGSIIAAGLAASQNLNRRFHDPAAIEAIYRERGSEIFTPVRSKLPGFQRALYGEDSLNAVLTSVFGDLGTHQLARNFVATFLNLREAQPAEVALGGPRFTQAMANSSLALKDIVRASASAPTYFEPAHIDAGVLAVDGGLFANNPALIAYMEADRHFTPGPRIVVSIGCGVSKPRYKLDHENWGYLEWLNPRRGVPLLDAMMRAQSDSVDKMLRYYLNQPNGGNAYYRFQFETDGLDEDLGKMDDPSAASLDALTDVAERRMMQPDYRQAVDALVRSL